MTGNRVPLLNRDHLTGWAVSHPVRFLLGIYAVSRVVALVALWVAATWFQTPAGVGTISPGIGDLFGLWDSVWYQRVAESGYPVPVPLDIDTGEFTYSAWAFFPLFPMLVRGLMVFGIPFMPAAVGLNLVLGAVGVVLVWAVIHHGLPISRYANDRLSLVAAALWSFYPATSVMLKPYTEPLAVVLVAGSLLLLMNRQYAAVAAVAVPLGFTRGVAPVVGVCALVHLIARWREDRRAGRPPVAGQRFSALTMLVVTGAAGLAWPALAGWLTGIPTVFFKVQAAWGQEPGSGPFVQWLVWAWDRHGAFGVAVLVGLVASYLALVAGRHGSWLPLEVRVWALAYPLYLFAVVRPITSMWRFLLLDFPIMALLASVMIRTSRGERIVRHWRRRTLLFGAVLLVMLFWWTAEFLTWMPWSDSPP